MKKMLLVVPMTLLLVGCANKKADKHEAVKKAEKIFQAGKMVLLEASASGTQIDYVTEQDGVYITTAKQLYANGEIDGKNPFKTESTDGGMTISYTLATAFFDVVCTGTIDGYSITYSSTTQSFTAK